MFLPSLKFLRYQATSYYPTRCGALLHSSQSHTKYGLQAAGGALEKVEPCLGLCIQL